MIMGSKATGAGDIPEDILGAMDKALEFDFYSKTCLIYLICDAPCHGTQYHDCGKYNDDYPDQPERVLEYKIRNLAYQTFKNVYFTAFKINDSTDKMFDIMASSFGPKFLKVE
jgi:hypothetical protein